MLWLKKTHEKDKRHTDRLYLPQITSVSSFSGTTTGQQFLGDYGFYAFTGPIFQTWTQSRTSPPSYMVASAAATLNHRPFMSLWFHFEEMEGAKTAQSKVLSQVVIYCVTSCFIVCQLLENWKTFISFRKWNLNLATSKQMAMYKYSLKILYMKTSYIHSYGKRTRWDWTGAAKNKLTTRPKGVSEWAAQSLHGLMQPVSPAYSPGPPDPASSGPGVASPFGHQD